MEQSAGHQAAPAGSRFVGRERELALLQASLDEARGGRVRFALVGGEPGIGKTRLVEELVAPLSRGRVLWGRCRESEGAPAYWPWRQALRTYAAGRAPDALQAELAGAAGDVARLVPEIGAVLPDVPPPPALEGEQARFHLFDAVTGFLHRTSAREPLVVVLDDLHWADSESLLLLRFLCEAPGEARLLVVGTYREVEMRQAAAVPRILADLARLGRRLSLAGLSEPEVAGFVRDAGGDVPSDTVTAIHRTTEGNPFFMKEVVTLLRRDGWGPSDTLRIPHEVRAVIRRRLDPLDDPARRLLATAAVAGREFDVTLVAAALGLDTSEGLARLAAATAMGLVAEVPGTIGRHRFAHALIQDTIYDDLSAAERAHLHRSVGEALAAAGASDGDLAYHFFRAAGDGARARAVDCAERAGDRARALLGYEEAAGHYERALEAEARGGGDPARRLRLLLAFGEAQACAGDVDGYRATFLEAARFARERHDAEGLARAALGYGSFRQAGGIDAALIGLLEEARRALGDAYPALRARVLGRLASATYYREPLTRRDAWSREALELARELGDPMTLATVLVNRNPVLFEPDGSVEERLALAEETIRVAESVGARAIACEARIYAVVAHLELEDVDAADRMLALAARDADELGLPHHRWKVVVAWAARALLAGRLADAERLTAEAAAMPQATFANDAAQVHAGQVMFIRHEQGRLGELLPLVAAMAEQQQPLPVWRCVLAWVQAESGHLADARATFEDLAAEDFAALTRDANWLPAMACLAEVCARIGDARAAAVLYTRLLPHARRAVVTGTPLACLGSVARYLGLLALTAGEVANAIAHLEGALAANARMGARPQLARAQCDLARALTARDASGDRERAQALVAEAAATATALGLHGVLATLDPTTEPPAPRPATAVAVLRREGDFWTIACGPERTRIKEAKGVAYLAKLLQNPGHEFHAVDLAGAEGVRTGDAGEVLDAEARAAYKRRLADLREELEEAEGFNDIGRAESLREEIEALGRELSRALGMGGRARRAGSDAERSRLNVTRAIHAVLRKITADCPRLGNHLERAVRTGLFCSYEPDPAFSLAWEL